MGMRLLELFKEIINRYSSTIFDPIQETAKY